VNGPLDLERLGGAFGVKANLSLHAPQVDCLRAELVGSGNCQAAGLTARGRSPALALCRKLLAAGHDPGLPVNVYRGDTLTFIIRTIGEGAWLDVADDRHGRPRFRRRRDRGDGAGSPVEEIDGTPKGRHGPAKRTEGGGP
jgi:hypothetical protein